MDMNLFIFSSKHWKELGQALAGKSRYHLALIFSMALTLAGSWWALQHLPATTPREKLFDSRDPNLYKFEGVIMGNSRMTKLSFSDTHSNCANLAVAGLDYVVQEALLRSYLDRMPRVRYLVLGMDEISYYFSAMVNRQGDYRTYTVQLGLPWWKLPGIPFLSKLEYVIRYQQYLLPFFKGPKLDFDGMERIHKTLQANAGATGQPTAAAEAEPKILRAEVPGAALFGFILAQAKTTAVQVAAAAMNPAAAPPKRELTPTTRMGLTSQPGLGLIEVANNLYQIKTNHYTEANHRAFINIVELCRDRKIKLVLVFPPTSRSQRKFYTPLWREELNDLAAEAALIMPPERIMVCDWGETLDLSDRYFMDPSHLNPEGGQLLGDLLNHCITLNKQGKD